MKRKWLIAALLFGLGLGAASGTRAVSEPADGARISRLISELASMKFSQRRQACRGLDAIGEPALDALRDATSHADMETCRLARELVAKIEKRLDTVSVLAPTRVRLACNDMPVTDAIAELARKARIEILTDPASKDKLAKRKITLDTGDVTFWEALDMLCRKAGLVETSLQQTQLNVGGSYIFTPQGKMQLQPLNPVILPAQQPIKPALKKLIRGQVQPQKPKAQPEKPKEARPQKPKDAQAQPQKPEPDKAKEAQAQPLKALPAEAARRAVFRKLVIQQAQPLPQAQIQRAQIRLQQVQVQAQQAQMQLALLADIDVVNVQTQDNSRIVLADGKPEPVPTCYAGAFRIRARTSPGRDRESAAITFEVTAEPRHLGWNLVGKPRLEMARDARGQSVTLLLEQQPNQVIMNQWGGNIRIAAARMEVLGYYSSHASTLPLKRTVQIHIKLGEKPGKLLEELKGQITVEAKTAPQALIVVHNILAAGGRTTRGPRGGLIEAIEVNKDKDGNHQVRFKIGTGMAAQPGGGLVDGKALFLTCLPLSGARADQDNVRLVDARGHSFHLIGRALTGDNVQTLTFKAQNGRAPAKLIFSAPLTVNVNVPFSFRALKLPN